MTETSSRTATTLTIAQLEISRFNVRINHEDQHATEGLERSILAYGLLQQLIVHPMAGSKKFGVIGGGRRCRALRNLIERRGDLPLDYPIEVVIHQGLDDAQLLELSLTENTLRRDLRTYEEHAAIARAHRNGATVKDLAEHLGQTVRTVRQWVRLGELAPPLLKAYQAGEMTLEQASAYASTADHALQVQVFEQLGRGDRWHHTPTAIRRLMRIGDAEEARLLRFVGEEAFRDAGGRFELDLFAEEAEVRGRVETPDILRQLGEAKRETIRERVRKLCPRAIRFQAEPPQGAYGTAWTLQITVPRKPLDGFDAERVREIDAAIDDLQQQMRANYDAEGQPVDAALAAGFDEALAKLEAEARDIEDRRPWRIPDGDIVATIEIDESGEHEIKWWWASSKASLVSRAGKPATASIPRVTGPLTDGSALESWNSPAKQDAQAAAKEEHGVSADGLQIMRSVRLAILRAMLVENARRGFTVGHDAFVWAQLRLLLAGAYPKHVGFRAIGRDTETVPTHAQDHVAATQAHGVWQDALRELSQSSFITEPDLPSALVDFLNASAETKNLAGAVLAGLALERSANAPAFNVPVHDMIAKMTARSFPAAIRKLWQPTAEMLTLLPRAQRLAVVEPLVDKASYKNWSGLKAAELIPHVLRVVAGTSAAIKSGAATAAREWIHPLLAFPPIEVKRGTRPAPPPPEPDDQRDILEILEEAAQ